MSLSERAKDVLTAIAESGDPDVTPGERLRAVEALQAAGGTDDAAAQAMYAEISALPTAQLGAELVALCGPVEAQVEAEREAAIKAGIAERLPAAVEEAVGELRPALEAEYEARARVLAQSLFEERVAGGEALGAEKTDVSKRVP